MESWSRGRRGESEKIFDRSRNQTRKRRGNGGSRGGVVKGEGLGEGAEGGHRDVRDGGGGDGDTIKDVGVGVGDVFGMLLIGRGRERIS